MVLRLGPFIELVLFHELWAWHNEGRGLFVRKVEEIDVGLHVTLCQQFDSNRLFRHFLFQLEVTLVLEVLPTARSVGGLASLLSGCLLCVLVEHRRLGGGNELVLLLSLGLLCNLADAGVRVEDGLQFHVYTA